ncbi:PulJ/GspJ family protein [Halopseudomonas salegens]|nr:prepilin-type N-terminal cleavage/methylation domain-containing protein [Halopseudomonas salegens]
MRSRGFTLMEVLVALTLTGLLVLVLFAGFRAGIKSWQLADQHTERMEESRQFVAMLNRHMQQLQAGMVMSDDFVRLPALAGTADSLRYVAPLSLSTGNQLYLIEIVSEYQGESGVWLRYGPFTNGEHLSAIFADAEFVQVGENLRLAFAFLGEEEWQTEFASSEMLPRLIRVQLFQGQRTWPALVFGVPQGDA